MISFHFIVQIKLWTYVCNIYIPIFFHLVFDSFVSFRILIFISFESQDFRALLLPLLLSFSSLQPFHLSSPSIFSLARSLALFFMCPFHLLCHISYFFHTLIGVFFSRSLLSFHFISISFSLLPQFALEAHLNLLDISDFQCHSEWHWHCHCHCYWHAMCFECVFHFRFSHLLSSWIFSEISVSTFFRSFDARRLFGKILRINRV